MGPLRLGAMKVRWALEGWRRAVVVLNLVSSMVIQEVGLSIARLNTSLE